MRKIAGIARYTFIEIFRNKVYYVLLLFAAVLLLSTLLLGSLGGEQRARMITDLGLAGIEMFALLIAVFAAVTLVLVEMESRTLYLILARPVARYQFILGRFTGLMIIITLSYFLMAGAHASLLALLHIEIGRHYLLSLYASWEKILMITSVAMVFSLFATSMVSAISFTFFFWVMGHLSGEIKYLAEKTSQPMMAALCNLFYFIAPNFQVLNLRDFNPNVAGAHWLWAAFGYGWFYTSVCLCLTAILFRKKEF